MLVMAPSVLEVVDLITIVHLNTVVSYTHDIPHLISAVVLLLTTV